MCCSDPPPPPDLGPAAEASMEVARIAQETSREQLAWAREQDVANREILNQVLDIQLPAMREQAENAREDRQRWETMFRPMEDQFVKEAQEYDTPERRAEYRARSIADVNTAFDASRRNALQRLESYGVDPSQTRNAALDIGVRTAQAATQAGAASRSDLGVEARGRELRAQAINLGRGERQLVGQQYAGAVGAGGQAIQGGLATTGMGSQTMGGPGAWGNLALGGYGQGANILGQQYGMEMDRYNAKTAQTAGLLQGVGNIAGSWMAMKDGGMAINPNGGVDIEGEFTEVTDDIPALLADGEYVIPGDVVRAKGEEFFDRLLEQYHDGPPPDSLKIDREAA